MKLGLKINQSRKGKNKNANESDKNWYNRFKRSRFVKFLPFLLLAFVIWVQQTLQIDVIRPIYIPISSSKVHLSHDLQSKVPEYLEIQVKDKGSEHIRYSLTDFDTLQLRSISEKNGNKYVGILRKDLGEAIALQLSHTATVVQMSQNEVKIPVIERIAKKLPLLFVGNPRSADGYTIERITLKPDSILVYGAPAVINKLKHVKTADFGRTLISENSQMALPIDLGTTLYSDLKEVQVKFELIDLVEQSYTLPITVINKPEGYRITTLPSTVNILVTIPRSKYKEMLEEHFEVIADYASSNTDGEMSLKISKQPSYVVHARISPELVQSIKERL